MAESKDKKNTVKMGVLGEPQSEKTRGAQILKDAQNAVIPGEDVNPGIIISKLDHPEFVNYGNQVLRVSPRERVRVSDWAQLPSQLPHGLYLSKLEVK